MTKTGLWYLTVDTTTTKNAHCAICTFDKYAGFSQIRSHIYSMQNIILRCSSTGCFKASFLTKEVRSSFRPYSWNVEAGSSSLSFSHSVTAMRTPLHQPVKLKLESLTLKHSAYNQIHTILCSLIYGTISEKTRHMGFFDSWLLCMVDKL